MRLIDADALRENMKFVCMGVMAGTEPYAAPLTEIDNAPTIEPEQQWIPCSERLPEDGDTVLVQFDDGDMEILTFPNIYKRLNRVAWLPLPEPYKERREE